MVNAAHFRLESFDVAEGGTQLRQSAAFTMRPSLGGSSPMN